MAQHPKQVHVMLGVHTHTGYTQTHAYTQEVFYMLQRHIEAIERSSLTVTLIIILKLNSTNSSSYIRLVQSVKQGLHKEVSRRQTALVSTNISYHKFL